MIKVFVGCAANGEDVESQAVLEYSIRKHASEPVSIAWMQLNRDHGSIYCSDNGVGWDTSRWATPFTALRWSIPAACNYEGKGIYFDSDFIVQADIAELWHTPMLPGKMIMFNVRPDCCVWDCAVAAQHLPTLPELQTMPLAHNRMVRYLDVHPELVQTFPITANWNVMDFGLPEDLDRPLFKAIHYTRMDRQLQLQYALPRLKAAGQKHWFKGAVKPHEHKGLQKLFDDLLNEAIGEGFTPESYMPQTPYGAYAVRTSIDRKRNR